MAGLLSYRRSQAEALPLNEETVHSVVARTRRVCVAQLAGYVALAAGFGWLALRAKGVASGVPGIVSALSLWGVLGAGLSIWDHLRVSKMLIRLAPADIAAETDPRKFWWKHRGVFPMTWENR